MTREERDFYQAIINIETEEECEQFFWDHLTPHELKLQVKRWQIVLKLGEELSKNQKERKTYKQIANELDTDAATVGRTARFFTGRDARDGYRNIFFKGKKKLQDDQ